MIGRTPRSRNATWASVRVFRLNEQTIAGVHLIDQGSAGPDPASAMQTNDTADKPNPLTQWIGSAGITSGAAAGFRPRADGITGLALIVIQSAEQPIQEAIAPDWAGERELYIIFLDPANEAASTRQRSAALMASLGLVGTPEFVYDQLDGFAVSLTANQAQRLQTVAGVSRVDLDAASVMDLPTRAGAEPGKAARDAITGLALTSYANTTASSGEVLPWGVKAVWQGADVSSVGNIGAKKTAFVIDSGINANTTDLNLSPNPWHRSWISGENPFSDGLGHGTHVSGTIGALSNGVGVVGVAPGATLVSLKVFNSVGGGATYANIIDAVNYALSIVQANQLNLADVVVNMSLGGSYSSSLDTAVRNAANKGLRFAIAAGNSGRDADSYSPAAAGDHANVWTVSAVDSTYKMPSFSNWDKLTKADPIDDVDVAAPGVSVLSYNGATGGLEYWNGTSMASPHAAGLLLMGGITPGSAVTPYFAGTGDPFAMGTLPPAPV
jgi:Subtilase family